MLFKKFPGWLSMHHKYYTVEYPQTLMRLRCFDKLFHRCFRPFNLVIGVVRDVTKGLSNLSRLHFYPLLLSQYKSAAW